MPRSPRRPGPRTYETDQPTPEADGVELDGLDATERRRRRARFLADLAEARQLRARVTPRRTRNARLREALRMRTFRW